MSRPPRIEVAGGVHHVVARGNERKLIYRDASDRERFLEVLAHVCGRTGWRPLCYCLMGNHYHLLLRTPEANLQRGMRQLNGVYAQWFNRRYRRHGHLFQGRYKAVLVQADSHLLSAVRYIVRNPLRAGLCERVEQWPWTSHHATIGSRPPSFLATDELLAYLAPTRDAARAAYSRSIACEEDEAEPIHRLIDGDETFVVAHLGRVVPDPEYPRDLLSPPRPLLSELVLDGDSAAIAHAHRDHGYSMRQIANHLDLGLATISRRIHQHERETTREAAPAPACGTWKT